MKAIASMLLSQTLWLSRTPAATAFVKLPTTSRALSSSLAADRAFCVIVEAEIEPNRMSEFLQMIETNAIQSRKEPDCLRFDVVRDQETTNKFYFYELYKNANAIAYHKEQAHYQAWADFKESGGVLSSVTKKADAEFVP